VEQHLATEGSIAFARALAASIETQRRVLGQHLEAEQKRLEPKATHEVRVALRRLLTALSLSSALGLEPKKRMSRRLRKLLSRLSPARDAHVQMRLLTELLPQHPGSAPLLAELRRRRRTASRRARKRLSDFASAEYDRDLTELLSALRASTAKPALSAAALLGQLAQRHLGVDHQMHGASADDPVALHALRVALKDYRYALEAVAPTLPDAREPARRCEELQNLLGAAHDTHVLASSARELADRQSSATLASLADVLTEQSRAAHLEAAAALGRAHLPWLGTSRTNH
jgi:CHAD domain-containing protein